MHALPDHNPGRQVHHKLKISPKVALLAGGGVLALFVLLKGRGASAAGGAPAAAAGTDPNAPSTFADNGGQASQLGNDVTGALGDTGLQLQNLTDAVQGLIATQTDGSGNVAPAGASLDPAAAAAIGAAVGDALEPAFARIGTPTSTKGAAAGKPKPAAKPPYRTVVRGGVTHHVYTDARGHVTRDVAPPRPHAAPHRPPGAPSGHAAPRPAPHPAPAPHRPAPRRGRH